MNAEIILLLSDPGATLETVGGKGLSLARMANAGFPVPDGFHIMTSAYRWFIEANNLQASILDALKGVDGVAPAMLERASQAIQAAFSNAEIPAELAESIAKSYGVLGSPAKPVAVRSSATAEDLPEASFAGQQETYLNICGSEAVLEAVKKCWASLWTARAISYRVKNQVDQYSVALAVVVQEMVLAESAGILFTANPVNGLRDEVVINAAWGLGEAIVGGQVTPDTILVDKATGTVKNVDVAEKDVMTVPTSTGTLEQPLQDARRKSQVLNQAQVRELVALARRIEDFFGAPQDIEWCWDGSQFSIVQSRPITAFPETALPEAPKTKVDIPVPTVWKLPKGAYAVLRNNIVELMADPLSPLFATLGLSAINTSLARLLNESFGMRGIMPGEIIIVVNHYAYNNGSVSAKGMIRMLFSIRKILKSMFTGAVERWTEDGRPRYVQIVKSWQAKDWQSLPTVNLVDSARQLIDSAIDAYGALISGVIPAAWITEALFSTLYNRLIKRRDGPAAPVFLLGYESLPIRADQSLYSLAEWARQDLFLAQYLERTPSAKLAERVASGTVPSEVSTAAWQEWQTRLHQHLADFGYMLYDLDFSHPVPADEPALVLDALKLYLRGQGANPYIRQRESSGRRQQAIQEMQQRLKGRRLIWFNKTLASAQKYAPLREDGLAEIGLAYPLIRQMLLEVGQRFEQSRLIPSAKDIFWLTEAEVREAAKRLDEGLSVESMVDTIVQRQREHQAAMRVIPPRMLPQMKLFGFDLAALKAKRGRGGKGDTIKGVAASPGKATGVARILHGPEDFNQMQPGDVLVAPITTPAWTPLFAMASAIVTDVGGPLSHGSIVAREYGIPAVLGTGVATHRIQNGQTVIVDGSAGLVTLRGNGTGNGRPKVR